MDHRTILERIGRNPWIGDKLGVSQASVSRWKTTGIPMKYWVPIWRLAQAQHVRGITIDAIERGAALYESASQVQDKEPASLPGA